MSNSIIGSPLHRAIGLFAARAAVRERVRVQVNNLGKTVEDRKQLYAELREADAALTKQIEDVKLELEPEDLRDLAERYEPEAS